MDYQQRCLSGIILVMVSVSIHAQSVSSSLRSSIKDDMRKDLLKQVKPSTISPNTQMRQSTAGSKAVDSENLLDFSKKYRKGSGGEEFEDKYTLDGIKKSIKNTSTPINKLPDGYVVPVFTGGRWVFANPTTRADGLVYPSGINLSGGGKKKMSAKAKAILENVFGMKVED